METNCGSLIVSLKILFLAQSIGGSVIYKFSRNMGIHVNDILPLDGSNSYPSEELIPMVSLLANKFCKISTGFVDSPANPSASMIPYAVAAYNKLHLKAGERPLELSITFVIKKVINESATGSPIGWDSLVRILDEANQIYPGTVKRIYVEQHGITTTIKDEDFEAFEKYFNSVSFPGHEKYEIGISLPLHYCYSKSFPRMLKHSPHVSFVIWPHYANEESHILTEWVFSAVEDCKRDVEDFRKDATIRLETGWLCLNQTCGPDHTKFLVRYLNELNDWAEATNISVQFFQAFDIPNGPEEGEEYKNTGLWKLVPNSKYKHVSEYVFEEKGSMRISTSTSFSWVSIFFIGLTILIAGLISGVLLVRYFHPNVFYAKVAPYILNIRNYMF